MFAGGGVKGAAYVGALQCIRDRTGVDFGAIPPLTLKTICGVSVGSLFALMILVGYNVAEITSFVADLSATNVMELNPMQLLETNSFDNGMLLKALVESILTTKLFASTITLKELQEKTSKSFHTIVTNLSKGCLHFITPETYPSLLVVDAIRASCAIPFVFPPVMSPQGDEWIDGGLMENYPIMRYPYETTVGFCFRNYIANDTKGFLGFAKKVMSVVEIPMDIIRWSFVSVNHKKKTIRIDVGDVQSIGDAFELNFDTRLKMLRAGYDAAAKFLDGKYEDLGGDAGIKLGKNRELPVCMQYYNS